MKKTFLITALAIAAFYTSQSYAQTQNAFVGTVGAIAVYQNGSSVAVNCNSGSVDVTNIDHIQFTFQEKYGTHPLGCLAGAGNLTDLSNKCNDSNSVKPVSGPAGWQEFSNSAGYLWTQDYPASKIPTNYAFKITMKMGLAPSPLVSCQFSTFGSSNVVIVQTQPAPSNSTVTGVYPYDCPNQFSPLPPVGTPCSSLVHNQKLDFLPNVTEYAHQHNIDQTQTQASCAANEPKGHPLCWSFDELATYAKCIGNYGDPIEHLLIAGGYANINVGVLFNGQPMYLWYRANNPSICQYYVPSPAPIPYTSSANASSTPAPVVSSTPVVSTPTVTSAPTKPSFPRLHFGRFFRR